MAAFALALYASLAWVSLRGEDTEGGMLRTSGALLTAWLIVPVALALVASVVFNPVFTPRNLIICLPAAYLLLALALLQLPLSGALKPVVAVAVPCLLLVHTVFALEYYWRPGKQQVREAMAFVAQLEPEFPGAILVGNAHNPAYFDYYLERAGASVAPMRYCWNPSPQPLRSRRERSDSVGREPLQTRFEPAATGRSPPCR